MNIGSSNHLHAGKEFCELSSFAIILFGHSRPLNLRRVLRSLELQGALPVTHVWIDGDQGNPSGQAAIRACREVVECFDVSSRFYHRGHLGFRKLLLTALNFYCDKYEHIAVLEDDCFPTREFIKDIGATLNYIKHYPKYFSCYGSHFGIGEADRNCSRFQGWGWATTSIKLRPLLDELIYLYSIPEFKYLEIASELLQDEK